MDILWICALSRISLDYFGVREISVGVEQMDHFNEMNASCGRKCLLSAVARGHIYIEPTCPLVSQSAPTQISQLFTGTSLSLFSSNAVVLGVHGSSSPTFLLFPLGLQSFQLIISLSDTTLRAKFKVTVEMAEPSDVLALLLSLFIFLFTAEVGARTPEQVKCSSSCGDLHNISYPFRLMGDPAGCGDADYELSCQNNKTILEFHSGKYYVKTISYEERTIHVVDVNLANSSCNLPYQSLNIDEVAADFRFTGFYNVTFAAFMNCSRTISDPAYRRVPCVSTNTSHVYVKYNRYAVSDLGDSCHFISMTPATYVDVDFPSYGAIMKILGSGFKLEWSVECRDCLVSGGSCVVTSFSRHLTYQCDQGISLWIGKAAFEFLFFALGSRLLEIALISRFILALVIFVFLIHKYRTWKPVDTAEKFIGNQQLLMPKRYSYSDILAMTNCFQDKLGEGGFGSVYKGYLPGGSSIAVKILGNSKFSGKEFINEVSTIGRIRHDNVVHLVGFCSEGSNQALVYEYMPNGSLDKHIFLKEGRVKSFGWEKLHEIALGTAQGIEYLHGGCDICILHFDIKPQNILLDHDFIPKISDFGLAKFYPKGYDFVSINTARGTIGYIAPELITQNFGAVSSKSDVYSFGMLLLEMAGGRRNVDGKAKSSSKVYFPSWVYDQLSEGGDLELGNITEVEIEIARKLCIVGLWCIQMESSDRPSMTKVIVMLEGNIDDLKLPPRPFFSSPQHVSIVEPQSDSSTELLLSGSQEESLYNNS